MPIELVRDQYGKGRVRLFKVTRHNERHEVADLTVDVRFEGDFAEAYTEGDNRRILPTDTMKNTVYALAAGRRLEPVEAFALALAQHFLDHNPQLARVRVEVARDLWYGIYVSGQEDTLYRPHPHAFYRGGAEQRTCAVSQNREALHVEAGLRGLHILKTKHSGFAGYLHDAFTTLQETDDRLLGTELTATWRYAHAGVDFTDAYCTARQALLDAFARHDSRSVQHTLYAMGQAALEQCASITEIYLAMPNKHRLPVNLAPFGKDNPNEIFVPVDEPYGLIEATLRRV